MTTRKKILIALGVLLSVALIVGLTTLATTTYGTKSDPLVALSYLNSTVTPNIENQLDDKLDDASAQLKADLDKKISQFKSDLSGTPSGGEKSFSVVSLSSGQTVTCGVGTEIMLRIGSVASYGPDYPRLIDETDGTELGSAGSVLTKNHMYMVTIQGNGIKAASSSKVLIRGDYTVG